LTGATVEGKDQANLTLKTTCYERNPFLCSIGIL